MAITTAELSRWFDQCLDEQIEWHHANAVKPLPSQAIHDYSAGFRQGWIAAVNAIKAHGGIVETASAERVRQQA